MALDSGARGSELVALSRAKHNLQFTELPSGAKQATIRMVPQFIPQNAMPDVIPSPVQFPGIAHLFPDEPERPLCPVRALGLYINKTQHLADKDTQELFVHFNPSTQVLTTHFRLWVAETIHRTYLSVLNQKLNQTRAHEVRRVATSIAHYKKTLFSIMFYIYLNASHIILYFHLPCFHVSYCALFFI